MEIKIWLNLGNLFFFFSLFVLVGGRGEKNEVIVTEKKKKWEKKPTFEMYTFKNKTKLQYTVYPIAHRSCQRVKILSVEEKL